MVITKLNVVITGAASGIGLAILRELLKADCRIVAADRDAENLEKVTLANIDKVTAYVGDLSIPEQVDQLFSFALSALGTVDLFIANAGFAYYEKLETPDWAHLEKIFRVNTISPVYSLLKMNQLNSGRTWKTVIISSAMADWTVPGYTVYSATKAALQRFAEGYRFDLKGKNLMVVYPIATKTQFFETAGKSIPMAFPVQTVGTVARKVVRGIRYDRRAVYTSFLFRCVLIINRILPFIRPAYQMLENRKFQKWQKSNFS